MAPIKVRLLPLLGALALVGCASSLEKVSGWMSSNADAFATLDGQILQGKMNFAREREGSLQVQTRSGPILSCTGPLRYTATKVGSVEVNCNDGKAGRLSFTALSPVNGTARGTVGSQPFLLTYGLAPEKAAGFLGVPLEMLATAPPKPATATPPTN